MLTDDVNLTDPPPCPLLGTETAVTTKRDSSLDPENGPLSDGETRGNDRGARVSGAVSGRGRRMAWSTPRANRPNYSSSNRHPGNWTPRRTSRSQRWCSVKHRTVPTIIESPILFEAN